MPKRKLRFVKRDPPSIGVCEHCNAQFKSNNTVEAHAELEIIDLFDAHKCEPLDSSQDALRIVRESTEGK
jgi:hypothetical protein